LRRSLGRSRRPKGRCLGRFWSYIFGNVTVWGNISEPWSVETKIVKQSTQAALAADEKEVDLVYANTGMNGVVPAWRIMELLEMPKIKSVRDEEEKAEKERLKREASGAGCGGS
jgi:hypothetical protein